MKWPNRRQRQDMRRMLRAIQKRGSIFVCLRNGKTHGWRTAKRLSERGLAFFAGSRPAWVGTLPYRETHGFARKAERDGMYKKTRLVTAGVVRPI